MRNKVIWIKKPKCAGTSIEYLLREKGCIYYVDQYTTLSDLEAPENKVICVRAGTVARSTICKSASGQYLETQPRGGMELIHRLLRHNFLPLHHMALHFPNFLKSHPKFGVIRNPFDKFVSSWRYLKKYRDLPAASVLNNLPSRVQDFHDWHHITRTQHNCIADSNGDTWLDFALYMENDIESDFAKIMSYLNIPYSAIPHQNKTNRQSATVSLDDAEATMVADIFSVDFEYFGYSTDISVLPPLRPLPQWNL